MEMEWNNEVPADEIKEVTVKDLETISALIKEQRDRVEEVKEVLKGENQRLSGLECRLIGILEELGKTSYESAVGRFGISHRSSVRVPSGDDRGKFFQHLQDIGEFESLITVNSQTLNGWYKQKLEAAQEAGTLMDFSVPGIDAPTIAQTLTFKKKQQ